MVTVEELYHTLHRRPFQPFRLQLTDGRYYNILYPRNNGVGIDFFIVGIPAPEDPEFVAERTIHVPLAQIERVEAWRPW